MYELVFYENKRGESEVLEYLENLYQRMESDKDSRILYCKIQAYFNMLEQNGTRLSKKITKHLGGSIWELRPLKQGFFMHIIKIINLLCCIFL